MFCEGEIEMTRVIKPLVLGRSYLTGLIRWGRLSRLAAVCVLVACSASVTAGQVLEGRVTNVRDADTIVVAGTPVRINGLDSVESGTAGFREAKLFAQRLVAGKIITCNLTGERTYDRMVGSCYVDGQDYAAIIIANGHGLDCKRYSGSRYSKYETPRAKRTQIRASYCE